MKIKTRVSIKHKRNMQSGIEGSTFFNTDIHDELIEIDLPVDDVVRHFNIGSVFTIPSGEYNIDGKFKVCNIYTNIYDKTIGDEAYSYNFHVVYEVERV